MIITIVGHTSKTVSCISLQTRFAGIGVVLF